MANPWFRMYTDFLDDPKMVSLAFEDQRHFIGILALKSMDVLDSDCAPTLLNRIVAQKLWIDFALVGEVKNRLMAAGLIDKDWQPLAWGKRQFVSDHDISGAERQRKYREKHRNALRNVTEVCDSNKPSNAPVTLPDTDTDTDIGTNVPVGKAAAIPAQIVVDVFHEVLPELPKVKLLTDKRKRQIGSFCRFVLTSKRSDGERRAHTKDEAIGWIRNYFERARENDFLMGRVQKAAGHEGWVCDIDYLLSEKGMKQVIEKTGVSA